MIRAILDALIVSQSDEMWEFGVVLYFALWILSANAWKEKLLFCGSVAAERNVRNHTWKKDQIDFWAEGLPFPSLKTLFISEYFRIFPLIPPSKNKCVHMHIFILSYDPTVFYCLEL